MADPAALLTRLEPGVELAAGKVRGLGPAVAALVAAGWLEARKDGRAVLVRLTAAGEAERARQVAAVPPPKAPKARAAASAGKPPTPAARLAALEATVAALVARIAALEAAPAAASPAAAPPPPAAAPADPLALRSTIVAVIGELDAGGRLGGLVPIPDVRGELRRRGVGASDAEVTAALEELERSWAIDLSAAQAPTAVADRAAGIDRAGRGLLYYVARR